MSFVVVFLSLAFTFFLIDNAIVRMYQNKRIIHKSNPGKFNIPFEEIHISLDENSQLYGWWIPVSPNKPTLILLHGWGRNLSRMIPYIRKLHPMGYNLLAIDARNHGQSSSKRNPTVWTFAEDICAAVNFIIEHKKMNSSGIGVIGLSVGGGAAINAAALDHRIQSVVTVGALSHPIEVMELQFQDKHIPFPLIRGFLKYVSFRFQIDFNEIAPTNNISDVRAPILLVHGEKDEVIPLEQGQDLYKAGNAETTRLWVVPGKRHSDCHTHLEFWQEVGAFLQTTMPNDAIDN